MQVTRPLEGPEATFPSLLYFPLYHNRPSLHLLIRLFLWKIYWLSYWFIQQIFGKWLCIGKLSLQAREQRHSMKSNSLPGFPPGSGVRRHMVVVKMVFLVFLSARQRYKPIILLTLMIVWNSVSSQWWYSICFIQHSKLSVRWSTFSLGLLIEEECNNFWDRMLKCKRAFIMVKRRFTSTYLRWTRET